VVVAMTWLRWIFYGGGIVAFLIALGWLMAYWDMYQWKRSLKP
jgi:hypothetical protein